MHITFPKRKKKEIIIIHQEDNSNSKKMWKQKRTIFFRLYIADCLKIKASTNKLILYVKMGNNNEMSTQLMKYTRESLSKLSAWSFYCLIREESIIDKNEKKFSTALRMPECVCGCRRNSLEENKAKKYWMNELEQEEEEKTQCNMRQEKKSL